MGSRGKRILFRIISRNFFLKIDKMDSEQWLVDDHTRFPDNFPEVANRKFIWVYNHKKEFVAFTLGMAKPTGFFYVWYQYCTEKDKNGNSINGGI